MSKETNGPNLTTASSESDSNRRSFVSGNLFTEKKVGGVLHFYKKIAHDDNRPPANCSMLCMVAVPSFFTCRELISFVAPMANAIFHMRIIRDDEPNQYMVILRFKSAEQAVSFFEQYNDVEFNSIEKERCTLLFVERLEMDITEDSDDIAAVTFDASTLPVSLVNDGETSSSSLNATSTKGEGEHVSPRTKGSTPPLPNNCSVCLERMDDGLMTILCNHTFHAECLRKWSDTSCPVCRDSQTPELVPNQTCKDCGLVTDLWMCLICGNIGCGRYTNAHAYQHFEATSHIFTLQVGAKMVWDYASDTYVHRLIQDTTNRKMVEYTGEDESRWEKDSEKLDSIQMEYSFYLTSQLENQRLFFEDKLREAEMQRMMSEKATRIKIASLEASLETKSSECATLNSELTKANAARQQAEKKQNQVAAKLAKLQVDYVKVQGELEAQSQMNDMLLRDKDLLVRQRDELEKLRTKEIANLEEQLHDLMLHFDSQSKIQKVLKDNGISNQELEESNIQIRDAPGSSGRRSTRRTPKKSNDG